MFLLHLLGLQNPMLTMMEDLVGNWLNVRESTPITRIKNDGCAGNSLNVREPTAVARIKNDFCCAGN